MIAGRSFWTERTPSARRRTYPAFRGQHTADVVVIGGGLTGAAAAYVLASGGADVVLVERGRIATGATAHGLGAILPQPDAQFREVNASAGLRVERTAWQEARRSAREFASALKKLSIRCDLTPTEFVVNTRSQEDSAELRREHAARKAAGLEAPWLSAAAAGAALGTDSTGALRLHDACLFDPVRAAAGLVAAAAAKGARIFEKSEVRRTRFTRKTADAILRTGAIRTRRIVVATGGPGALFHQLRRHVREAEACVVATAPLSAAMRREAGRRSAVVAEPGTTPHWLRWLPDDRAIFAGAPSEPVPSRQRERVTIARTAELMYELSVRYPVISGLPAAWGWTVPIVNTMDGLPWIGTHRNYPFHFFAMAFGWHGDGLAWLAAKAALREFTGEARREDDAFGFLRHQ